MSMTPEGRARRAAAMRAHWQDPEKRAKWLAARPPDSDETRAKKSRSLERRWADPKHRAAWVAGITAAHNRPDYIESIRQVALAAARDPAKEARRLAALRSPESRLKISLGLKRQAIGKKGIVQVRASVRALPKIPVDPLELAIFGGSADEA